MTKPKLQLSDAMLGTTRNFILANNSMQRVETFVYWAGIINGENFLVTTVIAPKARETWGSFAISAKANAEVVAFVCAKRLRIFAQLHTHPGRSVRHSDGDESGASFAYENFYSIVWPNYGLADSKPERWGIHRFEEGAFRFLRKREIKYAIELIPTFVNFHEI